MDTPALAGIIDEGTAEKIGGAKAHWPNTGCHIPVQGPDCEIGCERAHLRSRHNNRVVTVLWQVQRCITS